MTTPDPFLTAYTETQALLQAARPDQLQEAFRLLACEVAYAKRYHEVPSLDELSVRIKATQTDPASLEIVIDGLGHLAEVLRRLRVAPDHGRGPAGDR